MSRSKVEERRRRLRLDLLEVPWDPDGREIVRTEMDELGMNGTYTLVSYAPDWFTMIVHKAASEAGLPRGRRNAHMLRASFASHLIQAGASVPVVSRLLGHANISTTHRYAAVWEGDRRKAVDTLTLDLEMA